MSTIDNQPTDSAAALMIVTKPCQGCSTEVTREIPTHGFMGRLAELPFYCDACARAAQAERAAQEERQRVATEREHAALRTRYSELPAIHHHPLVDLHLGEQISDAATGWVRDGGGLLLTGEIGRGKTTIAGAACWELLQNTNAMWTSAPLLFARLGSGLGSDARDQALETLRSKRPLVLDDIDKARPTEYGAEQVFLAVDQRVEHQARLLVTTNLSPSELAARWPEPYGPAIASRLVGYCRVVRVDGPDRRLSGGLA